VEEESAMFDGALPGVTRIGIDCLHIDLTVVLKYDSCSHLPLSTMS
jgi:hypothetical protein